MRYSDKAWAIFNPALHCQNRLRHRDYLELIRAAGFAAIDEKLERGTAADLETLKEIPLAEQFTAYSPEELAVLGSHIVLRKLI